MRSCISNTHLRRRTANFGFAVAMLLCLTRLGYGQWTKHFIDQDALGVYDVHAADMDNDNDLDVVAAVFEDSEVVWYEAPSWVKHTVDSNAYPTNVTVADMDDDGDFDIVATIHPFCVVWYESPSWNKYFIDQNLFYPFDVQVADIDSDSDLDVIATSMDNSDLIWYEAPSWTIHIIDFLAGAAFANVIDFDLDNDLDIVVTAASPFGPAGGVFWYEAPSWIKDTIDDIECMGLDVGDIDQDSDLDVVTDGVRWYEAPSWDSHWFYGTLYYDFRVDIADLDNDNDLDIVVNGQSSGYEGWVAWYESVDLYDSLSWIEHIIDNNLGAATGLYVADMDGDNDLDVVAAARADADDVVWYENILGVEEAITNQSGIIYIGQPYPNPFKEMTDIRYQIPDNTKTSLNIYDATGRLVRQWDNTTTRQSNHIAWDGTDNSGGLVAPGVYFLQLSADEFRTTRKLMVVR